MRDANSDRRLFHLDTSSNIKHHDRANLSQNEEPRCRLRAISPPPLKRQCTAYEQLRRDEDASGSPDPIIGHCVQTYQSYNVSSLREALIPIERLSKPQLSCKPVCRVCDKTTATSYNPIITCPGCAKSYHDSCRKPPPIQGVDPQHWRCSACLNDARKHTRSISSSKPVLPRHSIVRDIFRPRGAESPATTNLSGPTKESTFDGHIGCQTFCASTPDSRGLEILNKPKDIIGSFLRSEPEQFDLSEVPRTPTRYLSKPDSSGSSSQPHHVRAQNEAVVLDSSTALQKCVSPIALCSVCQKRSILVRSGDGSAQCQACQSMSRAKETELLEIPETPEAVAFHNTQIIKSSLEAANFMVSTTVSPVAEAQYHSLFDPSRVTPKPKMRKVGDDKPPFTFAASLHDLQSGPTSEGFSIVKKIKQKPTPQAAELNRTSPFGHAPTQSPHIARQSEEDDRNSTRTLRTKPQNEPTVSTVQPALRNENDVQTHSPPQRPPAPTNDDAAAYKPYSGQGNLETIMSKGSPKSLSLPLFPKNLIGLDTEDETLFICQKRPTNRELARIALACANGPSMTAIQITDWLAQKLPYLQKGQGNWEKSLKTTLSFYDEFRGKRAMGSHDGSVLWSFAKAADKARYQNEYRVYLAYFSHQNEEQDKQEQQGKTRLRSAIESAPTRYAKSTRRNGFTGIPYARDSVTPPTVQDSSLMVSPVSATSHGSPLRSQAQPRKLSSSRDRVEFASGVKRETSFHDVYPCSTKRPIEIMTSEEKAAKAAQIRARPTRKELFDSNQRLAHVRRYRRQDIHDESDGAWEPESVGVRKKANRWKGDTLVNDCGRSRSLHEVFNLPANAIPMNNGNELAFRDGTLINGRLPRPRHTYRVGRRLGAVLTVM
ncbi:hypothetical protein ACJBU6_03236 [Exserohilum turcicum]